MAKINGKEVLLNLHISGKPEQTKVKSYSRNGTYFVYPDEGKTLSEVHVTVAIPVYNGETGDVNALLTMLPNEETDGDDDAGEGGADDE